MDNEQTERKQDFVYSKRLKAGKKRTYFIDIRTTKNNDYFLVLTESRKRFNEDGYERHKICLYREDVNKFVKELNEAVNYLKTELLPDYDFDAFDREQLEAERSKEAGTFVSKDKENLQEAEQQPPLNATEEQHSEAETPLEEADKW